MSPEQILRHLDDRYSLLTRGSRSAPTRQQTLQWCIDWSDYGRQKLQELANTSTCADGSFALIRGNVTRACSSLERAVEILRFNLQALAWIVRDEANDERSAVLMGTAQSLWPTASDAATIFPNMSPFHEEWERRDCPQFG